jgi:hypothetical protein
MEIKYDPAIGKKWKKTMIRLLEKISKNGNGNKFHLVAEVSFHFLPFLENTKFFHFWKIMFIGNIYHFYFFWKIQFTIYYQLALT